MRDLLDRRKRLLGKLPPLEDVLRGSIVERSICCGRASCHCAEGVGHPVTYLSVTLGGGKTKQISLPPALREQARRGVSVYLECWAILEEISEINRELLGLERENLRSKSVRGRGGGGDEKPGRKTARHRGGRKG
jgi:hypothetical protein